MFKRRTDLIIRLAKRIAPDTTLSTSRSYDAEWVIEQQATAGTSRNSLVTEWLEQMPNTMVVEHSDEEQEKRQYTTLQPMKTKQLNEKTATAYSVVNEETDVMQEIFAEEKTDEQEMSLHGIPPVTTEETVVGNRMDQETDFMQENFAEEITDEQGTSEDNAPPVCTEKAAASAMDDETDFLPESVAEKKTDDLGTSVPGIPPTVTEKTDSFTPALLKKPMKSRINHRKMNQKLKYEGKCYKTRSNKEIPAKRVMPGCNEKCKLICHKNVTGDQRSILFQSYWALSDLQREREYLKDSVQVVECEYPRIAVKKKINRGPNFAYYFNIDGERVRVCKKFFMDTLCINNRMMQTVRQKTDFQTGILSTDKRGHNKNAKCIPQNIRKSIENHIETLPRIESHYCRKTSNSVYVDGGKSLADIHRDYETQQREANEEGGTYFQYRQIFHEFNIKFFKPKKDQCEECVSFDLMTTNQKSDDVIEKHEQHLKEKELSRQEKARDKESSSDTEVYVYDLQAVMSCPQGEASPFYYISKLGVYNFTIVNIKTQESHCYVWDETQAKRGATEIGSCLWHFLQILNGSTKHSEIDVIFYSDNCCGQQKNQFVQSIYHYAAATLPKLRSITHKYLITGHTQNEGDSVHSIIERNVSKYLKCSPIYHPSQYITLIKTAKKSKPLFTVHEMSHMDFVTVKDLNKGPKVKMQQLHVMRVEKKDPYAVQYKNSYSSQYQLILPEGEKKKKCQQSAKLKPAYPQPIAVPEKKKAGLVQLLKKGLIPQGYAYFYEGL